MLNVYKVAAKIGSYTSSSRFASRHARTVADLLLARAPKNLDPAQQKALDLVQKRAAAVDLVRRERHAAVAPRVRAQRQELINAWSALHASLSALASIPPDVGSHAVDATAILSRLFPNGLAFVNGDAAALWSDTQLLFARMEEDELEPRIRTLVIPALLDAVRAARGRLGTVLGIDGASKPTAERTLAEVNALFAYAVANYARSLAINLDLDDEPAVRAFLAALQPLDTLRVDTRAGSKPSPDVEPEEGDFEEDDGTDPTLAGPLNDPTLPQDPEVNPFYHPPTEA